MEVAVGVVVVLMPSIGADPVWQHETVVEQPMRNRSMDATDGRILRLLVKNARASYRDLGAAVGLSANAVTQRLRRLEAVGIVRGYTVVLDPAAEGTSWQAVVHVTTAVDVDAPAMEVAFAAMPAVAEVLDLAGTIDYEVRLRCRSQAELHEAVQRIRLLPGVTSIETRLVMRHVLKR
jgi:Lrp/AsnC family leucine-responsive transcriptional regulator